MLLALASIWFALRQEAPATRKREVAVVVARAVRQKFIPEEFDCPVDAICMRAPAIGQFDRTQTIDGVRMPHRFAARMWLHGKLRRVRFAMIVERKSNGSFEILDYRFTDSSSEICFETDDLAKLGLKLPNAFKGTDGGTCFQP